MRDNLLIPIEKNELAGDMEPDSTFHQWIFILKGQLIFRDRQA
jgi:hypothetical protein